MNVLAHEASMHTNKFAWEGICNISMSDEAMGIIGEPTCEEILLNNHSISNNTLDSLRVRKAPQVTGK